MEVEWKLLSWGHISFRVWFGWEVPWTPRAHTGRHVIYMQSTCYQAAELESQTSQMYATGAVLLGGATVPNKEYACPHLRDK